MWAIRRASNSLKKRASCIRASQYSFYSRSETACTCSKCRGHLNELTHIILLNRCSSVKNFHHSAFTPTHLSVWNHCRFSSQAGEKTSDEDDDLSDGFSELESSSSSDLDQVNQKPNEEELISEPEFSDNEEEGNLEDSPQNDFDLSDVDIIEKTLKKKRGPNELFNAVLNAPGQSLSHVLDKWIEQGKDLTREDISISIVNFRKRRMYGRALQLSEWSEKNEKTDFLERNYASRLDLIGKVRGLHQAENYLQKVPNSLKGEILYRTFLANCVSAGNVKKAEETFNKMKDLELPISCFACNQLILLYKRLDKKKIADVLLLMEKENVKPSNFTYRMLIDTKGQTKDITGLEQIVETMKSEGIEPDARTKACIAKHYVSGGLNQKAEVLLKEMESGNVVQNRFVCHDLLLLYASIGKGDEVERLWKVCEKTPHLDECMAAIEAFGQLGRIEEAEAVFDKMEKSWKKLSSKHYSTLLKVYANHKMLVKGKDLVKRMADNGCRIGPLTWDALVKLYVESGELEKADWMLHTATQQNGIRPMFCSYMTILDQYAKKGDVHNAEKVFHRMRQSGYVARHRQFQSLVQAYINGKAPAYGIRERMKADNIFPNKAMAGQLVFVDAFRKTDVSDLLD